ncbi:Protein C9orf97, putative [Ricinus communis]|uniref:Protein C9orf97, putative n=1 Tax=Ricinus communis TaxID=3988 RepID=B9RFL0_RICCO|nr:Protein C9orf97, putative [Ricinus communis]
MADQEQNLEQGDNHQYGVLLYYKYTLIPDLNSLLSFYNSNCTSLSLLGRVRLSSRGVNVTVGGLLSSLKKHIAAVELLKLFEGTDFKLAASHYPLNDKVARECGFTSLSIRIVKELVTFSSYPLLKQPDVSNAGKHLSAFEFHSALKSAGQREGSKSNEGLVLLDARNLYETRIGKFHVPSVETLDPEIRQYSDLPSWIDDNSEQLRGKQVLMYCTGGIRCEMASAYIKSKGAGFENIFQLFGGIQRYLEQFPDGGHFKGKNFVFDHRISVASSDTNILGMCLTCGMSFDDYSSRCRCSYCRMLVLVCDGCQMKEAVYVCELCQKHGKAVGSVPLTENGQPEETMPESTGSPRKLRILCLHGFRQNASGFKGRTASLAKKLKNIAELVFIDAPHELPFIYQPHVTEQQDNKASFPSQQILPPKENCRKKFAWLIATDFKGSSETEWKVADGFSQGAAIAASVCALDRRLKEIEPGSINCPSLHIFGSTSGKDRQIANQASRELASLFEEGSSVIINHDCGHIIPTRPPFIDQIKGFLQRFL